MQDKSKKYGYFHGRFQPFHNGHMSMVKLMLENHKDIIIGLSNPFRAPAKTDDLALAATLASEDTRNPLNNPWPYWQRVLMIRWSLKEAGYDLGRVIFMPNLKASGFDEAEVLFPKDEITIYTVPTGAHNKLILGKDRADGWDVVAIEPGDRTISGTKVRELLRSGDEAWRNYVPNGTAMAIDKYRMENLDDGKRVL